MVAVVALAAAAWQTLRYTRLQQAAAALAGQVEAVRERAEKAEKENAALRSLAGVPAAGTPATEVPERHRASPAPVDLEQARLTSQLRDSLKEAGATISELEFRIGTLEEKLKKSGDENLRLSGSEKELRERVDSTVRLVDAVQTELKSRNERLLQLELTNKTLRDSNATASERAASAAAAIREVEEINRRRETYLANLLRRIRELTDQYRSIAVRMDNPSETPAAVPGELSRIQTTVTMAEEDLKQISSLSAQAARAQAKLK